MWQAWPYLSSLSLRAEVSGQRCCVQEAEYKTKWVAAEGKEGSSESDDLTLFTIGERSSPPITVQLHVEGKPLSMELDTGAAVSIISEQVQRSLYPEAELRASNVTLRTYTDACVRRNDCDRSV